MKKSLNIIELLHHKSKHHEIKLMHPSSLRSFQRNQKRDLKHPNFNGFHHYKQNKTKQTNNLPLEIDIL